MANDDLLNIENGDNKKDIKKYLIYGAVGFLVFVLYIYYPFSSCRTEITTAAGGQCENDQQYPTTH